LLKLLKFIENRIKIRKIQTQFCWILCEKSYNLCEALQYFFLIVFAWKTQM
jgi:hypothetical protein